ncbi:MAG: TIGR04283 family arsenosugar biosynthesis glycosyltransferase [Desulfobulbaceae bacterium]|nr:TIGR04283 family arsenosugar biosynthesis glycosyltransferase [Desulfobulbaceae bacterium]
MTIPKTLHISIIIPTLNEEKNLEGLLSSLQAYPEMEIIVCDGGSADHTLDIVRRHPVRLVSGPAGRGRQLNSGARLAAGDILVFLHCDTRLPPDFPLLAQAVLNQPGTVAGAFRLRINATGWAYRLIELGANARTRLLGLPYGDQALFMRKKTFIRTGGFPEQPLLEDLEMVRYLKRIGRIGISPEPALTSARRWRRLGIIKTTLVNQAILAGYLCGIETEKLARLYGR